MLSLRIVETAVFPEGGVREWLASHVRASSAEVTIIVAQSWEGEDFAVGFREELEQLWASRRPADDEVPRALALHVPAEDDIPARPAPHSG